MKTLICLSLCLSLFSGCSFKNVKPWEKESLAKPTMQFGGIHGAVSKYESHVYFSKEAARGGAGVGGGGCGCN